jgi:hypothetical protein
VYAHLRRLGFIVNRFRASLRARYAAPPPSASEEVALLDPDTSVDRQATDIADIAEPMQAEPAGVAVNGTHMAAVDAEAAEGEGAVASSETAVCESDGPSTPNLLQRASSALAALVCVCVCVCV